MILIDTSAWIEFLRKHGAPDVKARVAALIELDQACYSGLVEFELLTGAKKAEVPDVKAALSFSTFLEFPRTCWQRAADIEKQLRTKGVTVPRDDIFVTTAAIHHRVSILSCDPHFTLMRDRGKLPLHLA